MSNPFFDKPIVNSPYDYPRQHWELDESGQPTGHLIDHRRRADFVTPIPKPKKRRSGKQEELTLDEGKGLSAREQAYDLTSIINEVRQHVDAWRNLAASQWQVTPETARLLPHWRHHAFGGVQPFFCQVEERRRQLEVAIENQKARMEADRVKVVADAQQLETQVQELRKTLIVTEETALLQEAGVYHYRHPLTDVVAYEREVAALSEQIKQMTKKDGGAVLAATNWTVNGSVTEGRAMVRDFSKLMLRAFNAEADNLVRGLKPYKLAAAIERLEKVASTIERLGKTMQIRISSPYLKLRERELELTADFLQKQAEEKEAERVERERLREERKVQQEIERERARLEKERQHYENALQALLKKGDEAGAARLRGQLQDVDKAIADVDYRAANIRAGYVYVISNIGSFGERMVKVGMTRRLDPLDRIRELSNASVPFNFDIHALFFSKDAVGIESSFHERLSPARVNIVNRRREFFRATPSEVKVHLAELAGELLQFQEAPEALEYRQCLAQAGGLTT